MSLRVSSRELFPQGDNPLFARILQVQPIHAITARFFFHYSIWE